MKQKLQDYIGGKVNYTPLMNIFMGRGREKNVDPYVVVGKYIYDIYNEKLPNGLEFLEEEFKRPIKKFSKFNNDRYSTLSIFFLTSYIDSDILRKLFGEPLLHDEFGEGFHGDYDEETDEESEPDIKESYASYFVEINGIKFHIGYDHRGTSIEIEHKTNVEDTINSIKKLIYMCKNVM